MKGPSGADALLNFWKSQVEEATKAWTRAVNQAQAATDPAQFWRPVMDPAIGAWADLFARGPVSPELTAQWKVFLDQWIGAWGEALEQAMQSDTFTHALGRYLDQWVALQAPVQKARAEWTEAMTAALGVASRSDVAGIRRQLTDLEDRIDDLQDQVRRLLAARPQGSGAQPSRPRATRGTAAKRRRP
jgi:hypothetical protein